MSDTILSQKNMPWGNELLGTSNLYIHAVGCFVTAIAQALDTTPDVVNNKLKEVNGFADNGSGQLTLVIWAKLAEAFPDFSATLVQPYNNDEVLAALAVGHKVLVEVSAAPIGGAGLHCVEYIGNGQCIDPWDGTQKATDAYPNPTGYVVITQTASVTPTPPSEESTPAVGETYQGLDLTNKDSVKAAIDTWKAVEEGQYVTADEYIRFTNSVCEHLGIDKASDLTKITETIDTLKADFAKAVQASVVPAPNQIEGQGPAVTPTPPTPVTLTNVPQHEKESLLQRITDLENNVKQLLGL